MSLLRGAGFRKLPREHRLQTAVHPCSRSPAINEQLDVIASVDALGRAENLDRSVAIPNSYLGLHTVTGGDGKLYAYRVREMRSYLEAKFGGPKLHVSGPEAFLAATNKRGIIMFEVRWRDATGHFDMWNGKQARLKAHFSEARSVLMWW